MGLSRYERAAARRHYKLGKKAGKSTTELHAEIGRKLRISAITAYRIVRNGDYYDDDLREDEAVLKSHDHVDWDMEIEDNENDILLFRKSGRALLSRYDRAIIRCRVKRECTDHKQEFYQKIGQSYGVTRKTICRVVHNRRYGDNLDEDAMCLRMYDEMQMRTGMMVGSDGSGQVHSDNDHTNPSNRGLVRGRARIEAVEIPMIGESRSVRENLNRNSPRTGDTRLYANPARLPMGLSSTGRRTSSKLRARTGPVRSDTCPSIQLQARLDPISNSENDIVSSHFPHNQCPNVESFLESISLGHLAPMFNKEGFSTPENLQMLCSCSATMQGYILDGLRETYGSKFKLADKFGLALELRGLGSLA